MPSKARKRVRREERRHRKARLAKQDLASVSLALLAKKPPPTPGKTIPEDTPERIPPVGNKASYRVGLVDQFPDSRHPFKGIPRKDPRYMPTKLCLLLGDEEYHAHIRAHHRGPIYKYSALGKRGHGPNQCRGN